MKLIHCADLHLDSPMESNLSPERARERKGELRQTLARLLRVAEESGAEALLISGDLFDSTHITKSTEKYVLDLIASHPEVKVFYLAGNHDRGSALSVNENRPDNLFLFSDDWTRYELGDVTVIGSESPNFDTLTADPTRINLVMLHGQVQAGRGRAREEIIPLGKLRGKHLDYVALGHIHEYRATQVDPRCTACYCGCPEGRGFDECGPRGYVLVEIENGKLTHRFVPFAKRTLHEVMCDITEVRGQLELEERVLTAVRRIPEGDMVKLILTGSREVGMRPDLTHLDAMLSDRFYVARVRDASRQTVRMEDYQNDISLRGEFVRRVLVSELSEEERERVITCGLRALDGEEVGF